MDKIIARARRAPGLFLANIKTHLSDGTMDSGDKFAWWLLHDLQRELFRLNAYQSWAWEGQVEPGDRTYLNR